MGISVVICTHDGAARVAAPLEALQRQTAGTELEWEVLVVDNASTDGTGAVAAALWRTPDVPFRVVREETRGLSHARMRALVEAHHALVAFIDDDNEPDPDWLLRAAAVMAERADAGACGGRVDPVFRTPPPPWFSHYQEDFCAGEQASESGDVTDSRGYLWGAGLVVRRAAVADAVAGGFRQRLRDRVGSRLTGGGDVELCLAIRAAGWRLWYDRELRIRHHLPPERLTVRNLKRMRRANGVASVILDEYGFPFAFPRGPVRPRSRLWRAGSALRNLARHLPLAWRAWRAQTPDARVLQAEFLIGRLGALLLRRPPGHAWPVGFR
jgi:glycosyltransferase involved in cell wall biosynthesis